MENLELLANFYKHCLNVSEDARPNNQNVPMQCGWMRCYITPYLLDGKITNNIHPLFKEVHGETFCKFKNLLLYSLQDYIDYITCFKDIYDADTIQNTKKLIKWLNNMNEDDIVKQIEKNCNIFPSYEDCNNENILEENYNLTLRTKIISSIEDEDI